MKSSRRSAKPASRWMGLLVAAGIAAPGLVRAQPVDLFYERTVMTQADARCGLFAPEVGAALAASAAGFIPDQTGRYDAAFYLAGLLALGAAALAFGIRRPRFPLRVAFAE